MGAAGMSSGVGVGADFVRGERLGRGAPAGGMSTGGTGAGPVADGGSAESASLSRDAAAPSSGLSDEPIRVAPPGGGGRRASGTVSPSDREREPGRVGGTSVAVSGSAASGSPMPLRWATVRSPARDGSGAGPDPAFSSRTGDLSCFGDSTCFGARATGIFRAAGRTPTPPGCSLGSGSSGALSPTSGISSRAIVPGTTRTTPSTRPPGASGANRCPSCPVTDGSRHAANPSRNSVLSPNVSGTRPITPDIGATRRHSERGEGEGLGGSTTADARFRNSHRHTALTRPLAPEC
jgi:hypothetical protein